MADQDLWRKDLPEGWQGKQADAWDGEVPIKPILWSAAAVAISVAVAFVLNVWLMNAWDAEQVVRESPLAEARERYEHVNPKLQAKPEVELSEMQQQQETRVTSWGWTDELDQRIHMPVARAMELVLAEHAAPGTIEPAPDAPVDIESAPAPADEAADHAADSHAADAHGDEGSGEH